MSTTRNLAERFQQRWLEANPFAATSYGIPGYDDLVPDDSEGRDEVWGADVRRFMDEAGQIPESSLSASDAVTLGCLKVVAQQELDALESAGLEHTVTPMPFGAPASFLALAARTVLVDGKSAEDYLTRLRRSGGWIDQLCDRLRAGAAKGRTPVRPLVDAAIGWAGQVLADPAPAPLLAPQPPSGWAGTAEWEEKRRAAAAEIVKPALGRWVEVLRELRSVSRDGDHPGLCHLPGGDADYGRAIRTNTTLPLTAEQLHQTGLDEVAALEQRAEELGASLGLNGLAEIFAALRGSAGQLPPEEAIRGAVAAIRRAEAVAPQIFPAPLPGPCEVTPMPPVVAGAGTAPHYSPPRLDGGRAGTFWFNTEKPTAGTGWDLEVVAFHEAVPGHHLQLSRLQLLTELPALQRQRSLTVFSEGWGLYAEQLAEEVGLYTDARSLLGSISASLMRAARLVVDTGLHALGWSRTQANEFFTAHVPMPGEFLAAEVDRYIVMPGQALAYLTGKLEILRLREETRRRLGPDFSLPTFHAAVLDHGSLPMPVLARSIGFSLEGEGL